MSSFITEVITLGRKSKKEHIVKLRLVYYNGRYYASRKDMNSDWLKNMLVNPNVTIYVQGRPIRCIARLVNDEELVRTISKLKYNDERADLKRVVIELIPLTSLGTE